MNSPAEAGADEVCRRILDHVSSPVRIWTPDAGVIFVNRAWCELTGTTLDDNTGDGWLRCVHDEDRSTAGAGLDHAAEPQPRIYRLQNRDGHPVAMSDRPSAWTDATTQALVRVVHTLTPHVDAEERGKTMSRWAHELRGPLNAILGWSDLLSSGDSATDVVQRGLKAIANNARQQAQIIKRMTE